MKEPSRNDNIWTFLTFQRKLGVVVIFVPAIILVSCVALMAINSQAGWQKYPLPGLLVVVYVLSVPASPLIGIISLVVLFIKRKSFQVEFDDERCRLKKHVLIISILNILAVIVWVILFPIVFFGAGGSR